MESKTGSILLLISGILTIVLSAIAIFYYSLVSNLFGSPGGISIGLIVLLFIVILVIGILKLYTSKLMKNSKTTVKGGILALVLGIVTGIDILAIIGGIFGIVQGRK